MSQAENQKEAIDPEVVPKAKKRQYTAEYKRRVLQEYEACTEPGARGALLRREGIVFIEYHQLASPTRTGRIGWIGSQETRSESGSTSGRKCALAARE